MLWLKKILKGLKLFRNQKVTKQSRQQRRLQKRREVKMLKRLTKIQKKVQTRAEMTLNNPNLPLWIRQVKRQQLQRQGFLK